LRAIAADEAVIRTGNADRETSTAAMAEDFSTLAKAAAQSEIWLPSADELAASRQGVTGELRDLMARLGRKPRGDELKRVFKLRELGGELAREHPGRSALEPIVETLHATPNDDSATVAELRTSLDAYVRLLMIAEDDQLAAHTRDHLRALESSWNAYRASGDAACFAQVREHYGWLARHRQAEACLAWLRQQASRPNQRIRVSESLLNGLLPKSIEKPLQVASASGDATLSGEGLLKGVATIELVPNPQRAEAWLRFTARGDATVTGQRGAASVQARATLSVSAAQQVYLSDELTLGEDPEVEVDVESSPVAAKYATHSPLMRLIGPRTAMSLAERKHAAGDKQAEERLKEHLLVELPRQARLYQHALNAAIDRVLHKPLRRYGVEAIVQSSSTNRTLAVEGIFARPWQLAAPDDPPEVPVSDTSAPLLHWQTHESAVNNLSAVLAGQTFNEQDFRTLLFENFAMMPDDNEQERGHGLPCSFTFAAHDPVVVRVDDGCIKVRLAIARFAANGREHRGPWHATAQYRVTLDAAGVNATRQGPVRLESTTGAPSEAIAAMLPRFLIQHATSDGITALGEAARSLNLRTVGLKIDDGWLSLAIERSPLPDRASASD
jgi:hypothetical protein